jgi:HD-GYP domain-containing protein (c-di-GMP phosphodiesterase class II)/CheY-like chemotaxis protein
MKILILEDEQELRSLLSEIIESSLPSVEIWTAESLAEARPLIETNLDFDLLAIDENLPDGKGSDLMPWLKSRGTPFRYLLCSSSAKEEIAHLAHEKIWGEIRKPDIVEPFLNALEKLRIELGSLGREQEASALEEYAPIRLATLLEIYTLPTDVFIRISNDKFVVVAKSGEVFGEDEFRKFSEKSVSSLYVKRESLFLVLNKLSASVQSILQAKKLDKTQAIDLANAYQETIQRSFQSLGVSHEVAKAVKEQLHLAVRLIQHSTELRKYLERLNVERNSYINSHSVALSQLSGSLLSMMPWRSQQGTFKLAMASVLHDLTLKNQALAELNTLDDLRAQEQLFTERERRAFVDHPNQAAQLARQLEQMPPDVDTILLQHHERPNGQGFPHGISATRFNPLAAVFVIAHDLVRHMIDDKNFDPRKFLLEDNQEYNFGAFRRVILDAREFLLNTPNLMNR